MDRPTFGKDELPKKIKEEKKEQSNMVDDFLRQSKKDNIFDRDATADKHMTE